MARPLNSVILLVALLAAAFGAASAQVEKAVVVIVNTASSAWPDGTLAELLVDRIAETNGILVADSADARRVQDRIGLRFDKQAIVEAGLNNSYRYIVWCEIESEQVRVEQGFAFPFLAKQRRVTARLNLDYRIFDCLRGRTVASERLKLRRYGPSSMQYLDFTDADPDLYLSYESRKELFDRLETEAAEKVAAEVEDLARQR